jgi:hypothetical protein
MHIMEHAGRARVSEVTERIMGNLRCELAWRITEAAEAAQRFAHGLCPEVPTPEDVDRYFVGGLKGGAGDFAGMLRQGPTVSMVRRAARLHGIATSEALRRAEAAAS